MLPTGTVTFVFTDIEGSTQLLQRAPEEFPGLLQTHNRLIRDAFKEFEGIEVDNTGDGFFFVFHTSHQAVSATAKAQRELNAFPWGSGRNIRVRMGVHTGSAQLSGNNYVGLDVHKAARIMGNAYGGQVLLSQSVMSEVDESALEGISMFALGEFLLKDIPSPEVLYQLLLEGAASVIPDAIKSDSRKTNLPSRATPLLGRQKDIENVVTQVRRNDVRLMTFVGPGGIGKTSLAIESARHLFDDYPDGVYMVFLAPVSDAQFVPSAIAQVLGFFLHTSLPVTDQLRDYIGNKKLLLILDNFEHLIGASSTLVSVLEGCPNLNILVTSRSVLHLQWEWEYHVLPLASSKPVSSKKSEVSPLSPSVELFIQRACAIDPQFRPTDKELVIISEICERLDGLPLAIELAAARIKVLPPKTILSRLCKRLDLLRADHADLPERHQTLRHAMSWSYDLLEEDERTLFKRLSVYAGGFSIETAEGAYERLTGKAEDGLEVITSLRDQSLIRAVEGKFMDRRYMMLETIRTYGQELLEQEDKISEAKDAHARWFLDQAIEASKHFNGPDAKSWLDSIESDLDNFRAALKWCEECGNSAMGLQLCNALWRFWVIRAFLQEGVSHLKTQLKAEALPGMEIDRAKALNALGTLLHELSDYRSAYNVLLDAVDILRTTDEKVTLANTLNNLGWVAGQVGNLGLAEKYSLEAYQLHESMNNTRGMGVSMNNLGFVCFSRSAYPQMRNYYKKHYSLMESIGDRRGMAYSLLCQTWGEQDSGRIVEMQSNIDRATQMILELDDRQLIGWASTLQSLLFFHARQFEESKQYLLSTVEQATLAQNRLIVSLELVLLGASEMKIGNLQQAKQFLNEALGYASVRGSRILEGMATRHLAECYILAGNTSHSLDFISQSYRARLQIQNHAGLLDCAELLARVFTIQGKLNEAVKLLSRTTRLREEQNIPIQDSQLDEITECYDTLRSNLGEAEFDALWSKESSGKLEEELERYLNASVQN